MEDDMKQDFTNDLKKLMEIEKIGCSLHSTTPENICIGPTLAEEIEQEKKVNLIQEMSSNQDMCDRNTPSNYRNFYHSYEHKTYQLVDAEKQSNQFEICREKVSTSSTLRSHEFIYSTRRTLKHEILQKEMTQSSSLKKKGSIHSGSHLTEYQAFLASISLEFSEEIECLSHFISALVPSGAYATK
ncbi:zinc finger protein 486 isoform X1 [Biomphalaria glabrata]|nr:zinc finger protein 486 isoform X1 [Biomphalaria glabrata]